MILQLPTPGNGGRLGNALFTIASTIGIALRHGYTPRFPADWKYRHHFNIPDEWFGYIGFPNHLIKESGFSYCDLKPHGDVCSVVDSYLQSPKYWAGYEAQIRRYLTPKHAMPFADGDAVCIHHRRGDYIGNVNYQQLGWGYYLSAYDQYFAGKKKVGLSDDAAFLKMHYLKDQCSEIDDLIAGVECGNHIVSNSTFSWWCAYLSGSKNVVRPSKYFNGPLKHNSTNDFWPAEWIEHDIYSKLSADDSGVIIPVQYDHNDRLENLQAVCDHVASFSDIHILVGEINTDKMYIGVDYVSYKMPYFHRTVVINDLTKHICKEIVFNLDCDVLITPWQFYEAIHLLRTGFDMVWPYDGSFRGVNRQLLAEYNKVGDMVVFEGQKHRLMGYNGVSWGGVLGYRTDKFFEAGGENEAYISYSPEDSEREFRFRSLGYKLARVTGPLFHLDHWRGPDSGMRHPNAAKCHQLWDAEKRLKPHQVKAMIESEYWNNGLDISHVQKFSKI